MAANACSSNLLVVCVAFLKNARLECLVYYEWNVLGVQSALLWVVDVMSTDV